MTRRPDLKIWRWEEQEMTDYTKLEQEVDAQADVIWDAASQTIRATSF